MLYNMGGGTVPDDTIREIQEALTGLVLPLERQIRELHDILLHRDNGLYIRMKGAEDSIHANRALLSRMDEVLERLSETQSKGKVEKSKAWIGFAQAILAALIGALVVLFGT